MKENKKKVVFYLTEHGNVISDEETKRLSEKYWPEEKVEFYSGKIMNSLFIIAGMEDPSGLVYVGTDKTIVVTDPGMARHFMAFVAYRYNVRKDKEVKTWEVFGDFLNVKHLDTPQAQACFIKDEQA